MLQKGFEEKYKLEEVEKFTQKIPNNEFADEKREIGVFLSQKRKEQSANERNQQSVYFLGNISFVTQRCVVTHLDKQVLHQGQDADLFQETLKFLGQP